MRVGLDASDSRSLFTKQAGLKAQIGQLERQPATQQISRPLRTLVEISSPRVQLR
jgi:hypothetical protein